MIFFKPKYQNIIRKNLPKVKGRMLENVPFNKISWLGVGGVADFLFEPKDSEDLAYFQQGLGQVPVVLLGGCSNVLIRDGGIVGCVIRLGKEFSSFSKTDDGMGIICGGGAKNIEVAKFAMENGIGGMEFLYDIPGSIGGALRMNAGSHGHEIRDIVEQVRVCDNSGNLFDLGNDDMMFNYRESKTPLNWIFVNAVLRGKPSSTEDIHRKIKEYRSYRERIQPMGVRSAGCTFKNPEGMKAWQLIDNSGCRNLQVGGAVVSGKHCNFIINTGSATAEDVENLGEMIQERVLVKQGVLLEWEIRRIGVKKRG